MLGALPIPRRSAWTRANSALLLAWRTLVTPRAWASWRMRASRLAGAGWSLRNCATVPGLWPSCFSRIWKKLAISMGS